MRESIANAVVTTPDKLDVIGRPKPAKAELRDNVSLDSLSSVVMDGAKSTYGKQGAAAAQLGKNDGNFSRDVKAGRFTLQQMAELGPAFLAAFGKGLLDEYGPLATPQARARQTVRQMRQELDDLAQFLDHIA